MRFIRHLAVAPGLVVMISPLLSIAVAPAVQAGGKDKASFDMNDRLAAEKGALWPGQV